ncbi:MAG: citramalate synthase [Ruminococcaceae bacterium]|nr:citramalate synthase [Oscillospiraceae bacterium]
MTNRTIEIYDCTLRDGAQSEGVSFSVSDKKKIINLLDDFGVDCIEAGNPFSNPKDMTLFNEMKGVKLKNARLCAFGSTVKGDHPEKDPGIRALLAAETEVVAIVAKSRKTQVIEILGISPEENLGYIEKSVSYLKSCGKEVVLDAEHFFDGYMEDKSYAISCLKTALSAGADTLTLCDTNGGTLPHEVSRITAEVKKALPEAKLSIHCHDDCGCAVASSIASVLAGATQVQGTFIGYGERCGNADISTIIPALVLKCGLSCGAQLTKLRHTAKQIAEISNVRLRHNHPYIGKSAFAHKGGMHIDAVRKLPSSFEHVSPEAVGNSRKYLVSEMSGRSTILAELEHLVPDLKKTSPEVELITAKLKEREFEGYQYESANASFELLIKKELGRWKAPFNVIMYKSSDDFPAPDGEQQSSAMIKIEVGGKTELSCSFGNGPVNALDGALRKALLAFYPQVDSMHLNDYKVRVVDLGKNTDSKVRVLIDSSDKNSSFSTIGVSCDIIEASFIALVDSYEYFLSKEL